MIRRRQHADDERMEGLVYRLIADKQLAMALLAFVMLGYLLATQFLLLRVIPPALQAASAPAGEVRQDVVCAHGELQTLDGQAVQVGTMKDHVVVLHLDAAANRCVTTVSNAGVQGVVVGVEMETTAARAP